MRKRQYCFTIAPLKLLLIAVITVIVAAIIFPVFAPAHEYSGPGCAGQEKQIMLGVAQYLQDYDDTYPLCHQPAPDPLQRTGTEPVYRSLEMALKPYVGNVFGRHCPNDIGVPLVKNADGTETKAASDTVNGWFEYGMKRTQIASPAQKVYLLERGTGSEVHFHWWAIGLLNTSGPYPAWNDGMDDKIKPYVAAARHGSGSYVAYADGHVRWHQFEVLWGTSRETNALWP